jgi:hypothetical protein
MHFWLGGCCWRNPKSNELKELREKERKKDVLRGLAHSRKRERTDDDIETGEHQAYIQRRRTISPFVAI